MTRWVSLFFLRLLIMEGHFFPNVLSILDHLMLEHGLTHGVYVNTTRSHTSRIPVYFETRMVIRSSGCGIP